MSNHIAVSVVMPVYNAGPHLEQAVLAVLSQEFESFELILVDDGSTDDSGGLCDWFAERDPRVSVVHVSNGGQSRARNLGINLARGEYVAFCDDDDLCLPGFLSCNYELALRYDADAVYFGYAAYRLTEYGKVQRYWAYVPMSERMLPREDLGHNIELYPYEAHAWSGMYRKAFLQENKLAFREELRNGYEDFALNADVFLTAERVVLNPHVFYLWFCRENASALADVSGGLKPNDKDGSLRYDNHLLGLRLAMNAERILFEESGGITSHPSFCSNHLVQRSLACFAEMYHGMSSDQTVVACEKAREVLEEHVSFLQANPPQGKQALLYFLIRHGYYRALHTLIGTTVQLRIVLSELREPALSGVSQPLEHVQWQDSRLTKHKQVVAGLVAYNPDIAMLKQAIDAISPQVDHLLIYDNASHNLERYKAVIGVPNEHVSLYESSRNNGMSVALNWLCRDALGRGYSYILMLDQDSVATQGMVHTLLKDASPRTGLISALPIDRNMNPAHAGYERVIRLGLAITAGSLIRLDAFDDVGGYDEHLFVDGVDFDLGYGLRLAGYDVRIDKNALISHSLGHMQCLFVHPKIEDGENGRLRLRYVYRSNHDLTRRKDMFLAGKYLSKKYKGTAVYATEHMRYIKFLIFTFVADRQRLRFLCIVLKHLLAKK